jgi:nucleotide-binding universal stress UspA family protein
MFQPRRILHPTDFSQHSSYVFRIASDLARQNQATLLVLHTVPNLSAAAVSYGEVSSELEPEGYRRRAAEELRRAVPPPAGVAIEYLIAEGEPADEISRVAHERSCDLIVMATHGHTGLRHLFSGSVAEDVVRRAPCPVLTAKLPPAKGDVSS